MKKNDLTIKIAKSQDRELFPWQSFLWRLDNLDEKRVCWFECQDHAEKYIQRYRPKYKLIQYIGK